MTRTAQSKIIKVVVLFADDRRHCYCDQSGRRDRIVAGDRYAYRSNLDGDDEVFVYHYLASAPTDTATLVNVQGAQRT